MTLDDIEPTGSRLIVRRYVRPTMTESGLHLPESYALDKSHVLYEVVKVGSKASEVLGYQLLKDDIVYLPIGAVTDHPALPRTPPHFFANAEDVKWMKRWK